MGIGINGNLARSETDANGEKRINWILPAHRSLALVGLTNLAGEVEHFQLDLSKLMANVRHCMQEATRMTDRIAKDHTRESTQLSRTFHVRADEVLPPKHLLSVRQSVSINRKRQIVGASR